MIFDTKEVCFEDEWLNEYDRTISLFFSVPKSWLPGLSKSIIGAELCIEFPENHPNPDYAFLMMSPLIENQLGGISAIEWSPFDAPREFIRFLIERRLGNHEHVEDTGVLGMYGYRRC